MNVSEFYNCVEKDANGCWLWIKGGGKYGAVKLPDQDQMSAHRASWQITHGAIPIGLHVLHQCDQPRCVNPDHLFLGNHIDNRNDMVRKGRGKNVHGLPFGVVPQGK